MLCIHMHLCTFKLMHNLDSCTSNPALISYRCKCSALILLSVLCMHFPEYGSCSLLVHTLV